jgi:predicted aconitase
VIREREIAMKFIDEMEARECDIVFVGRPHIAGDEWSFEAATLAETTLLQTTIVSISRGCVEALRDRLIDELELRGVEFVEVNDAMMLNFKSSASLMLH